MQDLNYVDINGKTEAVQIKNYLNGKGGEKEVFLFSEQERKDFILEIGLDIEKVQETVDYDNLGEVFCWTYSIKKEFLKETRINRKRAAK